jgi:hypothetical protein
VLVLLCRTTADRPNSKDIGLGFAGDIRPREKNFGPFVTPGNHLLQFNSKDFVLLLSEKSFDRILFLCLRIPGLDF